MIIVKIFRESYTLFSVCRSCTVAILTILSILSFQLSAASLQQVSSVTVKTRAPQNELVTVWYRIPKNYHPRQKQMSRVLVLFGGRNSSGKDMASGGLEWGKWADENNAFLVSPGFKDDNYWEPEKWSGRALTVAPPNNLVFRVPCHPPIVRG